MKAGVIFIVLGLACLAAFRIIGSSVDENGMLHEPFALLPIGFLLLVAGALFAVVSLLRR